MHVPGNLKSGLRCVSCGLCHTNPGVSPAQQEIFLCASQEQMVCWQPEYFSMQLFSRLLLTLLCITGEVRNTSWQEGEKNQKGEMDAFLEETQSWTLAHLVAYQCYPNLSYYHCNTLTVAATRAWAGFLGTGFAEALWLGKHCM